MNESAGQVCPKCYYAFKVLADEYGTHPCPRCGYFPSNWDYAEDEDWGEGDWEEESQHDD